MFTSSESNNYEYQVGGSLKVTAPSYVMRQADLNLYEALIKGQFCYVYNRCVSIDITSIGSKNITVEQWYKGFASELWRGFNLLGKVNFKSWWQEQNGLSPLQRLSRFIEEILLVQLPDQNLFIFIDEIDSILGLDFSLDDFFALIRYFYNQRAENYNYLRLTFALFGVATPSDLIQDRSLTPFNIGKAIQLNGFQIEESLPLVMGLKGKVSNPKAVVKEILKWTAGQPFLTQKICNLVSEYAQTEDWEKIDLSVKDKFSLPENNNKSITQLIREAQISYIVNTYIINNWQSQDEPEHLKTIHNNLLNNEQRAGRLLGLYQQILQQGYILADDSAEQIDLLLSGLVIKNNGKLKVFNPIYAAVFNLNWIDKELSTRRPYSENLRAWLISNCTDESRLLRGKALEDALAWGVGKSLSDRDYQFLAASQELEKQAVQMALTTAQTANQMLAQAQAKAKQTIRRGLIGLGVTSTIALSLISLSFHQVMQVAKQKEQANISEIKALALSSQAKFESMQEFDALLESLQAASQLQQTNSISDSSLIRLVETTLEQAFYWVRERNRLEGHNNSVITVGFSENGELIASGDRDGIVKIWTRQGKELQTLKTHQDAVWGIDFSENNQIMAIYIIELKTK